MLNSLESQADAFPAVDMFSVSERIHDAAASMHSHVGENSAERRLHKRFKTAFRASCVIIDGRPCMAMIKNMSRAGVMVHLDERLSEGDIVHYFWDERRIARARVAWSEGNLHGLDNDEEQIIFDKEFNYRSVRVPCVGEAEAWIDGARYRPMLVNLSLGGAQLEGLRARVGALVTLRLCGVELTNACVRWSQSASAGNPARMGLAFSRRMSASQLSGILSARELDLAA
ncbi:MAG: PilZ domain-containing protein [Pseudomonadota bacterium]